MRRSGLFALALFLLAGSSVGPASADLLVTRAGEVVVTRGAWEVRGKTVVFTGSDGVLRSLRAADVDLEESRQRTLAAEVRRAKASSAAESKPEISSEAPRKAVLVLTDADVRHVRTAPKGDRAEPAADEPSGNRAEAEELLRVTRWSEDLTADGVEIRGTLRNVSDALVAGVSLVVDLKGEDGRVVESRPASLVRRSLTAGEATPFTARFDRLVIFDQPSFVARGSQLAPAQASEAADAADAESQ